MAKTARTLFALGSTLLILGSTVLTAFAADTTTPADVQGLQVTPGDGEVSLTWDPATDDTGVTGYFVYSGLSSVEKAGEGFYTYGSIDAGNVTTYTLDNLSNDVTYFFAITAYDAAGNESEFYSAEVSATPTAGEVGDFIAPTVTDAKALSKTLVEVTFSEAVSLPTDGATAFSIESTSGEALEITDAYVSDGNTKKVLIVTAEQADRTSYLLTASSSIEDAAGNPIVSGTSDTALFLGTALASVPSDTTDTPDALGRADVDPDFSVDKAEMTAENEVTLTFTKDVVSADTDSFEIAVKTDPSVTLEILAVVIDEDDPSKVSLLTEAFEPGEDYIITMNDSVLTDNDLSLEDAEEAREIEFTAETLDLADLIAPEDITNFLAKTKNETTATLTWTKSIDTAGDLAHYMLYRTVGDGKTGVSFGKAVELAANLAQYDVTGLTAGETYTFKVTAVDENGNESEGMLATVTLPEAGPALWLLGGLSIFGAGALRRRRQDEF